MGNTSPKGLALAALIVGIVAFLFGLVPVLGILLGLAGVGLGIFALVKKQPKGLAITGLVLAACGFLASCSTTAGLGAAIDTVSKEAVSLQSETPATDEPAEAKEPKKTEAKVVEEPKEEPAPEPKPAVEEPQEPELSIGQRNAVNKAKDYLSFTAFSRTGLIEQLEFEGFDTEDATFAVDHIAADWNAQAAKKAQEYLDFTSFSRQGLVDQLVFEGFTAEQAEFGVAAVGY